MRRAKRWSPASAVTAGYNASGESPTVGLRAAEGGAERMKPAKPPTITKMAATLAKSLHRKSVNAMHTTTESPMNVPLMALP